MRAPLLLAAAALCLVGCRNNDQVDNTQNIDENLTAENIVSNDVTAIDAVTGDAANMAADVEFNDADNSLDNAGNATSPSNATAPAKSAAKTKPTPEKAPAKSAATPVNNTTD